MKKEEMPRGGLYERINAIRADAILEAERDRRSTFGGAMNALKEELPPLNISRSQAAAVVDAYDVRQQAQEIVDALLPRKL